MQDAKEEIRARLTIEDVIGEYVQLKRAGRNFKGLSPFSGEKTPSFIVSPDKNIWHDFSSNKGGDVFSFVMEVEGLDFRGALELLARRAGIDLSIYDSKGSQELAKQKRRLLELLELATKYYQQSLVQNERVLDYVFRIRGLSRDIVQTFRLGYAPDTTDALVQFLRRKGFTPDEIGQAGMTNRRGGDLFRGRMMVPLMDASGQVIGFTGRILNADPNAPKYLNTPQTILYDKSKHVFGLSQAKESIRKADYAVIVEGNLDVVSSHQAGVLQTVATAGTALTESHLKILSRLSGNIRLAFDGDAAGIAATERSIPIAQHVGVELTIITLPSDVKDPDELIQKDISLWQKVIDEATPIVDWLFAQYSAREDMTTPRGKRRFTTVALDVVRHLSDQIEQEHYLQRIADDTGASLDAVKAKFFGVDVEAPDEKPLKQSMAHQTMSNNAKSYQDTLLAIALVDPSVRELLADMTADMLEGENRRVVFEHVRHSREVIATLPKELQDFEAYVIILIDQADAEYGQWSDTDRLHELARLVRIAITEHKQTQKETLTAQLRDAEDIGDETVALQLRQQINELIKEMQRAKR